MQPPRANVLTHEDIFPTAGGVALDKLREHLEGEGKIKLDAALAIVQKANSLFLKEQNVIRLKAPVTSTYFLNSAPMPHASA